MESKLLGGYKMDNKELKLAEQLIKTKEQELESWKEWIKEGNSIKLIENKRVYKALMYDYIGELMTDEELELYNKYRQSDINDLMHYFNKQEAE